MRQKPLLFQFLKDSLCDYVALASLSRLKQSLYRDNVLISGDECCSFCVVDFMGLSHFINRGWLYPRCGFPWEWIFVGVLMWLTLAGIMSYNVRVTPGQVRADHQDAGQSVWVMQPLWTILGQSRSSTTHPITLHSPLHCLVCFEVHKLKTSSWWTSSAFISHVRTDCAQTSSERIFNVDCNNYPGLTPTWHTQHASEH